jgi:hypothetical protein
VSRDARTTDEHICTQVERIRVAVAARHGVTGDALDADSQAPRLDDVARLATITAHWGITSDARLIGPLIVYWRRAVRLLLRWYINPLVEQQNSFNQAVVRALFDLQVEYEDVRAELASRARPPE